jgi:hypothetical protein
MEVLQKFHAELLQLFRGWEINALASPRRARPYSGNRTHEGSEMPNLLTEFSTAALTEEIETRKAVKAWLNMTSRGLAEMGAYIVEGPFLLGSLDGVVAVGADELKEFARRCADLGKKFDAAIKGLDAPAD